MPASQVPKRPETKRLAALLTLLVMIAACSLGSSRDSASDSGQPLLSDSFEGLRKRIGVAPFELRTQHTDAYSRELMQLYLLRAIRNECPGFEFVKPLDENYPPVLQNLPRLESGDLDNLQAAVAGRQLGLNAVMVGTLTSVGTEEKERGFWMMRRNRHYVQVQVLVEIYDTETAAKLVDETASREVEIDAADAEMIRQRNRIHSGYVEEVLEFIAEKIDEELCEALSDQQWKSFVLSSESGELWIASGSRSGLQVGLVLEVFDSNTIMEGYGGHRYFKPGPKIAEVQLVAVEPLRSKALLLTGRDIPPLSVVKIK